MKAVDIIRNEYYRVKDQIERRPSRMDLFTYMDDDIYALAVKTVKNNPFKDYLGFLHDLDELDQDEKALYDTIGKEFIHILENTNMTKVYKMPVLKAFHNRGDIRLAVTETQLLEAWKDFFGSGTNWKDLPNITDYAQYKAISDREHVKKIMDMPVHFLLESGKGFFVEREGYALAIRDDLKEVLDNPAFGIHFGDVIDYRAMDYYRRRYLYRE